MSFIRDNMKPRKTFLDAEMRSAHAPPVALAPASPPSLIGAPPSPVESPPLASPPTEAPPAPAALPPPALLPPLPATPPEPAASGGSSSSELEQPADAAATLNTPKANTIAARMDMKLLMTHGPTSQPR